MRQRAAVAQALIMKPEILLLDEPFGAVDEATREELQRMLLELYADNCDAKRRGDLPPYTMLIVTHELNEAIYVGDRVVALSRYWDWQGGHTECPGATVVYDQMAPVNLPDAERDFETFAKQRKAIREAIDRKNSRKREEFMDFWSRVNAGSGDGVLADVWDCDDGACPLRAICSLAREVKRIAKKGSSAQPEQVSVALRRAVEEGKTSFAGVMALWSDPKQTHRLRQIAAKECFWYPARTMLAYLDKHAPEVHVKLSKQLSDLMNAEIGRPPGVQQDTDGP
jgi:ATPase subunit of ABC transporter with duplicated ATPase domains